MNYYIPKSFAMYSFPLGPLDPNVKQTDIRSSFSLSNFHSQPYGKNTKKSGESRKRRLSVSSVIAGSCCVYCSSI